MPRKPAPKIADQSTPGESDRPRNVKEEISYLRQRFHSMMLRGYYKECFKLIEDNLSLLYFQERWPENFLSSLRLHKKCYPSLDISQGYDDYLTALLKKHGIPLLFARLVRSPDNALDWSAEAFKILTLGAMERKDLADALDYCELMIKLDPTNSNGYLLRGWILDDMQQGPKAAEAFQQALDYNESNYQAWNSLANHYSKTSPSKALECINRALEMAPAEAGFYIVKSKILAAAGDRKNAVDCVNKAIALDPLNAGYPYRKGELLLEDGQTLAAIRQYTASASLDDKHTPSLLRLATLLGEEQADKALPYITSVVALQPENVDAMLLRARLLRRLGEGQQAVRQYNQILLKDENCAQAHAGLGRLLLPESPDRALRSFEQAARLDEKNADYHLGKAQALEKLGQTDRAIEEYLAVTSLDKRSAKAYAALGYLHVEHKPAEAAEYFGKALEIEPENPYYLGGMGEAQLGQGRKTADAIQTFHSAVRHDPGNARLRLRLAQLLERAGSIASATEHYRFAVSLEPDLVDARHGLARVLLEYEPHIALSHITRAIVLDANNAEHYYLKAQILDTVRRRGDALLHLKNLIYGSENSGDIDLQEISQILNGEGAQLAMLYINRAAELAPHSAKYMCTRAGLLFRGGRMPQALEQYRQVLALDSHNPQALYGTALIQASQKDKKALDTIDKAIALDPANPDYRAAKASMLAKSPGEYRQALAEYDAAIALDKERWRVVLEKATLLDSHGDFIAAQVGYRRVLLIYPDCLEATARMGMLLAEHNAMGALNYLDKASQMDPADPRYPMWRARLLYGLGREPEAEEAVAAALSLCGEGDNVHFQLAELFREKLPRQALRHIAAAVKLAPDRWEYRLLQGDIHNHLEQADLAAQCYLQTLALNQRCHQAMGRLAEIYRRQDNPECSLLIDQALELAPEEARYLICKAEILAEREDLQGAADCAAAAVKAQPDSIPYRELLVDLLEKKKARLRAFMEKGRLDTLHRKRRQAQAAVEEAARQADPPPARQPEAPLPKGEPQPPATAGGDTRTETKV